MKVLISFISIIFFVIGQFAYSQNSQAIIYLNRLKKSTESATNYSVIVDNKKIGEFLGTSPVFTQKYFGAWMAFSLDAKNKTLFEINKTMGNETIASLLISLKAGEKYFITFDPSASVNDNPLKLIENERGFNALYNSDNESIKVLNESIRKEVFYDKKYAYLQYAKVENKDNFNKEIEESKNTYAFFISNKNDRVFQRLQEVVNYSDKVIELLKESEFDFYKSYTFNNAESISVMTEFKNIMSEFEDNDNVLIYYLKKDNRIYIAGNHKIEKLK